MLLTAKPEKEFERIPAGTHAARCWMIADIGTQKGEYQGKPTLRRQIVFSWETPTKVMEDGRPFVISETYTAYLGGNSKLRSILETWRGGAFTEEELKGVDPIQFLMLPAFISIVHQASKTTGKIYANVGAVMQVPEGMNVPTVCNGPFYFSFDNFNQAAFDALPEWVKNKAKLSPEWEAATSGAPPVDEAPPMEDNGFNTSDLITEDDIPY